MTTAINTKTAGESTFCSAVYGKVMTTAINTKTVLITNANFKSEVLESDRPVLVEFWAPWCGPCLVLGPTIEELADEYEGSVKVGKLNVDENPGAAGTYGVQSIPSVLLFESGDLVQTFVGVQSKQHYEQALDKVLPQVYRSFPGGSALCRRRRSRGMGILISPLFNLMNARMFSLTTVFVARFE